MDTDLVPLLEKLDGNLEDLEGALSPLLKGALTDKAETLPILDRAHLYILVTYVIELLLSQYLQLNGVEIKEHPLFRELARVKQYMTKLSNAESRGPNKSTLSLDKSAAERFITHALAGNDKYDLARAQQ